MLGTATAIKKAEELMTRMAVALERMASALERGADALEGTDDDDQG